MQQKWWHGKTAYQIYPRSFKDSNGDGVGDLPGIIEKIPYLAELGIELLWISPIYKSPFADMGYDISDYQDIDPVFGSMEDFKRLKAEADKYGIGIIMDLVVNHCSDEHEWFKKACADPSCKEASYFIIREGKDGKVPNNLRANFGGSVWDKLPGHDNLYYCHFFHKKQPDLDWFNPELRQKIYEMMNWWLVDMGIAGFRVDAIMCIGKDPSYPQYEPDDVGDGMCSCGKMNSDNVDVAINFLHEMNEQTFRKHDKFAVGEVFGISKENVADFIGDNGVFSSIFDFSAREALTGHYCFYGFEKLSVARYREVVFAAQETAGDCGFLAPVIENHDEPRGVSTWLPPMWHNAKGAKALGTVNLTLKGIPFIFQGQELGMLNTRFDNIDELDDCQSKDQYAMCKAHGLSETVTMQVLNDQARDHGRVPMSWDDSEYAGFSTVKPWMKVNQDKDTVNVATEAKDPDSVLNYYRKLIKLRRDPQYKEIFTYGEFVPMDDPNGHTLAYLRRTSDRTIMVVANFGAWPVQFPVNESSTILLSSDRVKVENNQLTVAEGSSAIVLL
ncbi:alpha-glucosidase [Anaerobiospirillum sp. NML120449]|uniref:glycoside hydrolase family 13 protein n=1 Tax=Anaerobiospirillum sp. NML120449 TaxID=2932817 RepID=UPI001FF61F09|nr:alpha-glucosidase [Anaerobiospirillum sp. NML120449]MCK0527208.1 alpha-glucosidase [Anaerobiospirillum sp. NML120449]